MARTKFIEIRRQLTSLISTRALNELARLTGLVKRRRKVEPMALFWTIVLGFGEGRQRKLAGLRRLYQKSTGETLVPSAFYDRFTKSLAEFFRVVVAELIDSVGKAEARFDGILASFKDVVATDSTLVRLHDLLERSFPACRTNHTRAAAKLHVVMSVRGRGPRSVKITSGRQHDGPVFRVGRWVKDRLLLFDLGYFRYALFDAIDRHGGYFVSRLKENANPLVTATWGPAGGGRLEMVGQRLRDVVSRLRREEVDIEVEVTFPRRTYAGVRSGARRRLRVVGVRDAVTARYHLYATNIPVETLSAKQVAAVYTARWQVELLFKEMKSHYRLAEMPSRKRPIVETLLLATVVTLIVSRRLLQAVREKLGREARRVPDGRWAAIFAQAAGKILDVMLLPRPVGEALARWLEPMLVHEAVDPNLSRSLLLNRVECASIP